MEAISNFGILRESLKGKEPIKVVAVEANDEHSQWAIRRAEEEGWAKVVNVHCDTVEESAAKAVRMVRQGEAQAIIAREQNGIARAARRVTDQPVSVAFGPEHYPTREYDTFSLPAGTYPSLRVTLGAGAGHNWWCVVFPPLCVESALSERAVEALSEDDVRLITEDGADYVVRFRILELWDALSETFK